MRRMPYSTESTAECVLTDFYRQLTEAERRHDAAMIRRASFDEANRDEWDLIDAAGEAADRASDQVAEIELEIEGLEREMGYGRAAT